MEDLSLAHRADQEQAALFDDAVAERTEGRSRRPASGSTPVPRIETLLDGLSAYAALFDCSTGCQNAHA